MNVIQRIQDVLMKPRETWPVIEQENGDIAGIYREYLVYLAAVPAIASFIGLSLVGLGSLGVSMRVPFFAGLAQAIVGFGLTLAVIFVVALIVDAFAPTFGGTKNRLNAFKVVAYGSTASLLGGIVGVLPGLAILGLLASIYSIYLVYTGLPVLMKCRPDKAAGYTAVVVVCGIVALVVLSSISTLFMPAHVLHIGASDTDSETPEVVVTSDDTEIHIDAGRAARMAKQAAVAALAGASAPLIAVPTLNAWLPETIGDLKRQSYETHSGSAMGVGGSVAEARYGEGERNVQLSVVDLGGFGGLASVAAWANITMNQETDKRVEKVYKEGDRTVHEEYRKDGSRAQYTVILANGVLVACDARGMDIETVKQVVEDLDLTRVEALKREAPSK
jgi:hypothetical protein